MKLSETLAGIGKGIATWLIALIIAAAALEFSRLAFSAEILAGILGGPATWTIGFFLGDSPLPLIPISLVAFILLQKLPFPLFWSSLWLGIGLLSLVMFTLVL